MARTRWAMVGTGLMLELIGRDFALVDDIDLQVIVSRTQTRADEAAAKFAIPEASGDFEQVLTRDDIDVVYVATPHSEHLRQAMAALDAGKHVLVEKSMTTSAADTRRLCEHARACGLFAMEAMWTAFNPVIIEARRRIAAGEIGEPRLMQANFCFAADHADGGRLWQPELGGGSMLDQGVYPVSLAHMIFGSPTSITGRGTIEHGVDAEVAATLDFADGGRAQCITSLRAKSPWHAFIGGTDGTIELRAPFWSTEGFTQSGSRHDEFTVEHQGMGYVPMLQAVSDAISAGATEHPLRSHAETVAVAETMDELLRQLRAAA